MNDYSDFDLSLLLKMVFCQLHANKPVIRSLDGCGWDIMLRLDGTYFSENLGTADEHCLYFGELLAEIQTRLARGTYYGI